MFLRMNTYIIGFCLMDAGPIASGIAFDGYDENGVAKHDRVKSVVVVGLVLTTKVKMFL
jgi:hypothetical protein